MKIDKIVTLANRRVRLRVLAMERSLRAVGCDLPLWVIPYDNDRFDLPRNAQWWELPEVTGWLARQSARPVMRKYQCLTTSAFQFVDADVCFLRDPRPVLEAQHGFVTSCGHWHNPSQTVTPESQHFARGQSTIWQSRCFNTGQFACDQQLYTVESLQAMAESPECIGTCLHHRFHEQPGLNLLVWKSGVDISNLTLPPVNMESTWAGDYPGEYRSYWTDESRRPYLLHWAGTRLDARRPIDDMFLSFLTTQERQEWEQHVAAWVRLNDGSRGAQQLRRLRRAARSFVRAWKNE